MSQKCIFYCMAGAGLGNASRFEAIYQQWGKDVRVYVFCWGNSYSRLSIKFGHEQNISLNLLRSYTLPSDAQGLRLLSMLRTLPVLLASFILNSFTLLVAAYRLRPSLSVHDSDYHYFPFILLRIPRLLISQSAMIVHNRDLLRGEGLKTKINYYIYEYSEYLASLLFGSIVVCPSFDLDLVSSRAKLIVVKPIVRSEFISEGKTANKEIVVLSGGSGIDVKRLKKLALDYELDHFFSHAGVHYSSLDNEGIPLLANYRAAVIQAGHVLISECLSMGVLPFALAIAHHPEQVVNMKILNKYFSRLGLDYRPELDDFIKQLCKEETTRFALECDGARKVVSIINAARAGKRK